MRCIASLLCLLLTVPSLCFVDECNSLGKKGLRSQTHNITLDFSVVQPISDPFRFYRNVSDDGFVQYVSEIGFRSVSITGYAYNLEARDTDWYFELRTGNSKKRTMSVLRLNATNLHVFKKPWPMDVSTNWTNFEIDLGNLPRCPKVIELWFRGSASGNLFPGWGLQVGEVRLEESLFESCKPPECLLSQPARCFESLSSSYSLRTIHDRAKDFTQVFMASDNMNIATDNAVANFNGDKDRFDRSSVDRGIVSYSIPDGIATIEITFYRCENNQTKLTLKPYIDPLCKPLVLTPALEDDSYYSNCWRRYKTSVSFSELLLPCPPTYIDLVVDGDQPNSLQIANVVLTGYGPLVQDPEFKEKVALRQQSSNALSDTTEGVELTKSNGGSNGSVKIEHWLPATIVGGVILFAIVAIIILYRNDDVRDFIVDYVEDNCPFIYNRFWPPEPPKSKSPSKSSPGGKHPSNNPWAASGSIGYSCTFDGNLKKTREPTPIRDVKAARDGLGEQLIDLSKHLQTKFWTSKVRKKQHVVEIEERLGKGGFGKIWKARWQGTVVALKVVPLHANLRKEEKQAKMAIMEAALSGCLAHPNIVSTYACEIREADGDDFDDDRETISVEDTQNRVGWVSIDRFAQTNASKSFMKNQSKNDLEVRIIMEYCDRGSMVMAIKQGRFRNNDGPDMEAIILTALDIARGLSCLHENDIIHGDLKPHNVLIQNKPFVDSRGFIAKIADFGLSIKMESEQSHVEGMRMGTGGYVSPEVAVHGKILPASDIYSFGILLWEMYTGELIQDAIKDAPKVSSRQTMGSWRPIFKPDCLQAYSRLACMCWNDFPDWRPTLDYIIDELNNMFKTNTSMPTASQSVDNVQDGPELDSVMTTTVVIP